MSYLLQALDELDDLVAMLRHALLPYLSSISTSTPPSTSSLLKPARDTALPLRERPAVRRRFAAGQGRPWRGKAAGRRYVSRRRLRDDEVAAAVFRFVEMYVRTVQQSLRGRVVPIIGYSEADRHAGR